MTAARYTAIALFVSASAVWSLTAPSTSADTGHSAASSTMASIPGSALERAGDGPAATSFASALATSPRQQSWDELNAEYDAKVHFVRVRYSGGGGGFGGFGRGGRGGAMWAHDYPRAERNFMEILEETTFVDALTDGSNVLALDDPELFKFPIAYIVEVGYWSPSDEDVAALGEYLRKGGFLIVDDTRDERGFEYRNFVDNMARVLPDLSLLPLEHDHEIFDSFFRIDPLEVMPPYGPRNPMWFGIFEDNDPEKRLMVVLNLNNDIAEYWEISSTGYYRIDLTNEAYKLGVNYLVYALTH